MLTAAAGDALVLDAFELTPGSPVGSLKAIAALTGGSGQDASPAFAGHGRDLALLRRRRRRRDGPRAVDADRLPP